MGDSITCILFHLGPLIFFFSLLSFKTIYILFYLLSLASAFILLFYYLSCYLYLSSFSASFHQDSMPYIFPFFLFFHPYLSFPLLSYPYLTIFFLSSNLKFRCHVHFLSSSFFIPFSIPLFSYPYLFILIYLYPYLVTPISLPLLLFCFLYLISIRLFITDIHCPFFFILK